MSRCRCCGAASWPALSGPAREAWTARARRVLLVLAALVVLAVTAVDALFTALIGMPPVSLKARAGLRWLIDRYRMAGSDVIDADVVGEEFTPQGGR